MTFIWKKKCVQIAKMSWELISKNPIYKKKQKQNKKQQKLDS